MVKKTVRQFEEWLLDRGRAATTATAYGDQVEAALELSRPVLRLRDDKLSPNTRRQARAALAAWARFTGDGDLALALQDFRLPPKDRVKLRRPFEDADYTSLREEVTTFRADEAVRAVLNIMLRRGLRVGDVLRMKRTEINAALKTGRLMYESKGAKRQNIKVDVIRAPLEQLAVYAETHALVRKWERVDELLSPHSPDQKRRYVSARQKVQRALRRAAKRAGLDPGENYPHRIRRTVAVQRAMALRGDPQARQKLQRYMGWRSPATADEYIDYLEQGDIDKLDDE